MTAPAQPDVVVCIEPRAVINENEHPEIVAEAHRQAEPTDENAALQRYNFVMGDDDEAAEERTGRDLFDGRYNTNNNNNVRRPPTRRRAAAAVAPAVASAAAVNPNNVNNSTNNNDDDNSAPGGDDAGGAGVPLQPAPPPPPEPDLPLDVVLESPVVFFCNDCNNNIFGFKKPRTPQLCLASGFICHGVAHHLPLLFDVEKLIICPVRVYMVIFKCGPTSNCDKIRGHIFSFEHNSPQILGNDLSKRGKSPSAPWFCDVFHIQLVGSEIDLVAFKNSLLDRDGRLKEVLPQQVPRPTQNELQSLTIRPHVICMHLAALSRTHYSYSNINIDESVIARQLTCEFEHVVQNALAIPPSTQVKVVDLAAVRDLDSGLEHHQLIAGQARDFNVGEAVATLCEQLGPVLEEAQTRLQADTDSFNKSLREQIQIRRENDALQQQQQLQQMAPRLDQWNEQVHREAAARNNNNDDDNQINLLADDGAADGAAAAAANDEFNALHRGMARQLLQMMPPVLRASLQASTVVAHPHDPVRMDEHASATTAHMETFVSAGLVAATRELLAGEFNYDGYIGSTPLMQHTERGLAMAAPMVAMHDRLLQDDTFFLPLDSPSPVPCPINSGAASSAHDLRNVFLSTRGTKIVNDVDIVKWLPLHFPWYFPYGSAGLGPRKLVGKPKWVEKLLLHGGAAFAFDSPFQLMLADRNQRMSVARAASLSLKIRTDKVKNFIDMVTKPDFLTIIDDATKRKDRVALLKIWTKVSPTLNVTYGTVPFSPAQRVTTLTDMFSLTNFFGPGALFVTFAPDDTNNALALKILRLNRNTHIDMTGYSPIAVFDHPDAVVIADERFSIPDELEIFVIKIARSMSGCRRVSLPLSSSASSTP